MKNWFVAALLLLTSSFGVCAQTTGTGTLPTQAQLNWPNENALPTCTLSTTTGSIAVTAAPPCASASGKSIAWNLVGPLTGNATLAFPTGLVDGVDMGFDILHGTGGSTLSFAANYIFPSASLSSGQPSLTNVANAEDLVICHSVTVNSTLGLRCGFPLLNMTAVTTPPAVVQTSQGFGSATGITTKTISLTGVVNSSVRLGVGWCQTSTCTGNGTSQTLSSAAVTTGTGSCSIVSSSSTTAATAVPSASVRCSSVVPSGGNVTVTLTWSANTFWQGVGIAEISNDNGVEGGNSNLGSSATASVTTGTLSQSSNELILAFAYVTGGPDVSSVNSPYTFIHLGGTGSGLAFGWLATTSGSATTATFPLSGSGAWTATTQAAQHS